MLRTSMTNPSLLVAQDQNVKKGQNINTSISHKPRLSLVERQSLVNNFSFCLHVKYMIHQIFWGDIFVNVKANKINKSTINEKMLCNLGTSKWLICNVLNSKRPVLLPLWILILSLMRELSFRVTYYILGINFTLD